MTPLFFESQIERLASTFGGNHYKRERTQAIWREAENVPDAVFSAIVTRLISECRQAPLVPEIREAIRRSRGTEPTAEEVFDPKRIPDCSYCKDSGIHLCTKGETNGLWAFRCHCRKGMADKRTGIPQFKQWHQDQGFIWSDRNRTQ